MRDERAKDRFIMVQILAHSNTRTEKQICNMPVLLFNYRENKNQRGVLHLVELINLRKNIKIFQTIKNCSTSSPMMIQDQNPTGILARRQGFTDST